MILDRPFVDDALVKDTEIAWLSGIWDGEGSVSAFFNTPTNPCIRIQMQMTCKLTIDKCIVILTKLGMSAIGFGYQEKMAHHKDAFHIRINRVNDGAAMARYLMPYSVTKLDMWKLCLELCEIKLARRRIMPDGKLSRGGSALYPMTPREELVARELIALNYRKKPSDMEIPE